MVAIALPIPADAMVLRAVEWTDFDRAVHGGPPLIAHTMLPQLGHILVHVQAITIATALVQACRNITVGALPTLLADASAILTKAVQMTLSHANPALTS